MRNTYFRDYEWTRRHIYTTGLGDRPPSLKDKRLEGVHNFYTPNKKRTGMSRRELAYCKKIAKTFIGHLRYNREYRLRKISLFYGRIHAFDVDAVKTMAKKYKFVLKKECLYQIFENNGRKFEMWKRGGAFWGGTNYRDGRDKLVDYPMRAANVIDVNSRNSRSASYARIRKSAIPDLTYNDRLVRLEGKTLLMLRFLLKKGSNPNEPVFLENMIFKYKWHSKIFFLKVFEMCIKYGLNEFNLDKVLRNGWVERSGRAFFLYPVNPYMNHLDVKDTVKICRGWIRSKQFDRVVKQSKKGIGELNDDVIGIISTFLYEPLSENL